MTAHGRAVRPGPIFGQTHSDEFDACLEEAVTRADERATNGEGSGYSRFVWFAVDVAACTAAFINPFT
ncbi:MAG: hypothetical protein RQ745_05800 [Longimicrobiales bacterium]|nr:hypothetical protein [Longimicrobiales bacterium]